MTRNLVDGLDRTIDYVRISVTDRCDFRCIYCMAEQMSFLPRQQVLTLEEIERTARLFITNGIKKIRLTGGEPLVRQGIVGLCERISAIPGLNELVMTSNGSQLEKFAKPLANAGVRRLNISLDSLRPERFRALTRLGDLAQVLRGIEAARRAGFESVKLNSVIIKGRNEDEVLDLAGFALEQGLDISFIEEMPLGHVGRSREQSLCTSDQVRELLAQRYSLLPSPETSGGPARYTRVQGYPESRIGFISPHSHNFCSSCNRVRLTAEGKLLLCLGNEHDLDLRALLRRYPLDDDQVQEAIHKALKHKPARHEFSAEGRVQIVRFMNASGG